MNREFLFQLLLLMAAVATALGEPSTMAAAIDYSWEGNSQSQSEMNITTYRSCVGLHCLVADNVEADDLFMDQHDRRKLANTMKAVFVTPPTKDQGKSPDCQGRKGVPYTTCFPSAVQKPCPQDIYKRTKICKN